MQSGVVAPMIALLKDTSDQTKEAAIRSLRNLIHNSEELQTVVEEAGVYVPLVQVLFLATARRVPTANAEGATLDRRVASESSLGETRLWAPSDRHGCSAFAVGVLRDIKKKNRRRGGRRPRPARAGVEDGQRHVQGVGSNLRVEAGEPRRVARGNMP